MVTATQPNTTKNQRDPTGENVEKDAEQAITEMEMRPGGTTESEYAKEYRIGPQEREDWSTAWRERLEKERERKQRELEEEEAAKNKEEAEHEKDRQVIEQALLEEVECEVKERLAELC